METQLLLVHNRDQTRLVASLDKDFDTMLNLWTIDLQVNERNWEVELSSGISKTMYIEQDKFETNMIKIGKLITTVIFIIPNSIQQCYNKDILNHVDKIQI